MQNIFLLVKQHHKNKYQKYNIIIKIMKYAEPHFIDSSIAAAAATHWGLTFGRQHCKCILLNGNCPFDKESAIVHAMVWHLTGVKKKCFH